MPPTCLRRLERCCSALCIIGGIGAVSGILWWDSSNESGPDQPSDQFSDDRDEDGVSDTVDAFPDDASQSSDADNDGYGDAADGRRPDGCPTSFGNSTQDRYGCPDRDGDGWSDPDISPDNQSADSFPDDPLEWADEDGDGFGDNSDAFLYISMGDGGSGGDPQGHGQDRSTLLGSILRIDVDNISGGLNYTIPEDNPFVGNSEGWREEIWAYGLRNPWRFSFDPVNGDPWVADVGQSKWEEVDIVVKGGDYGWNTMEGKHCYSPSSGCNESGLELPLFEYDHNSGCSITGGFVYRGNAIGGLYGDYIYADYCSGMIWALSYDGTNVTNRLLIDTGYSISSLAVDSSGEIYIIALASAGTIHLLQSETS